MRCSRVPVAFAASLLIALQFTSDCPGQTPAGLSRMEARCIDRVERYRERPTSNKCLKLVGANDEVLEAMRGLQNVERLSLICVCRFTDDGIKPLSTIRGVSRLSIGSPNSIFTGAGLMHLDEMPTVETLTLMGPVTDLRGLRNFPNLKSLDVARCILDDDAMKSLVNVPQLEVLKIARSPQVTDAGIAHVAVLKKLRELSLSGTSIGDEGISNLTQLARLEQLTLSSRRMTSAGLESISRLKRLRSLSVSFYDGRYTGEPNQCLRDLDELTNLTLRGIAMTDNQIACLSRLPKLRDVEVSDPTVDDDTVAVLSRIQTLQRLKLVHPSVTSKGLKHLENAPSLEHLIVYFPEYLHPNDVTPLRHILQDRYGEAGKVGFARKR